MSDKPRVLIAFEPLPQRATAAERIATLDADVREAAGKVERRLRDRALQLHVMGWHEDETTEYAVAERTVIGRLRISREATP
jgi:hypothetical protein